MPSTNDPTVVGDAILVAPEPQRQGSRRWSSVLRL